MTNHEIQQWFQRQIREKSTNGGLHPFYKKTLPPVARFHPFRKTLGLCVVLCVVLFGKRRVTSTNCRCEVSRDNLHVQEGYPLHVDLSRVRITAWEQKQIGKTEIETDWKRERDRETERQRQTETDRQTEREKDRERETDFSLPWAHV